MYTDHTPQHIRTRRGLLSYAQLQCKIATRKICANLCNPNVSSKRSSVSPSLTVKLYSACQYQRHLCSNEALKRKKIYTLADSPWKRIQQKNSEQIYTYVIGHLCSWTIQKRLSYPRKISHYHRRVVTYLKGNRCFKGNTISRIGNPKIDVAIRKRWPIIVHVV